MNNPATRILNKPSANDPTGCYTAHSLLMRYGDRLFIQDGYNGYDAQYIPVMDWVHRIEPNLQHETLKTLFNPSNPNHLENIEWLLDSIMISIDDEYWPINWDELNIIAINPSAEWCEICEVYEMPLPDNITSYIVGSELVCALINGDVSGLEQWEEESLESFEANQTEGINNFHWSTGHDIEFDKCEITGFMGNCVELHLVNMDNIELPDTGTAKHW